LLLGNFGNGLPVLLARTVCAAFPESKMCFSEVVGFGGGRFIP